MVVLTFFFQVIDDLCKLVNESSYGKCRFCKMPTESLVLSVLHILSDAAQISKDSKGNTAAPPILDPNVGGIFSIFFNFNLLHFVLIFFFISSNDFFYTF